MNLTTLAAIAFATSAVLAALGAIYVRILRPALKAMRWREEVLPVLNEIAAQFRTNSGSSLRDEINAISTAVDQIKEAADIAHAAAQKVSVEVAATSAGQRTAQDIFVRIESLLTEIRDQRPG